MSLRRTAPLFAALAACLALLAVAVPLAGAQKPHATKIVVSLKFPAFHGSLKSADDGCLGGRSLSVTRRNAGKTKKLGSGTSKADGSWKILVGKNLTSGEYTVNVAPKGECKGARSKALTID
jgi:hypothetical protein